MWERPVKFNFPLDRTAYLTTGLQRGANGTYSWSGKSVRNGDMMVQINSGSRGCIWWVSVRPLGIQSIVSEDVESRLIRSTKIARREHIRKM